MSKMNLAVIFGGMSTEHDVSCVSADTVIKALDREKYDITLIGITKDGHWRLVEDESTVKNREWETADLANAVISPDTTGELIIMKGDSFETKKIDVAFPVLHGLYGEDGTIQGLFELSHIPYVGCGHLSSAVTMDKFFTKIIADSVNVRQTKYVGVRSYELVDMDAVIKKIEAEREYPVFVKPSCAGSSIGVSKAHNRDELIKALNEAAKYDSKILVEETMVGRELECAVFGFGDDAFAAGVGEILAAAEFYDFDAKYNNEESKTIINPELPEGVEEKLKETALKVYRACDCFGLSRVDFFLEDGTNDIVFNEINAIPGHTSISMYPMLMEAAGHPLSEYLDDLIDLAFKRK